jgi:hypothetical protein
MAGHRDFVIRGAQGGVRNSETLVIGPGVRIADHQPTGLPELLAGSAAEAVLLPSGGDDTAAIQAALHAYPRVRLAPGVFPVSSTLFIPSRTVLAGSGVERTRVSYTGSGSALSLGDGCWNAGVESLTLTGPGQAAGGVIGIVSWWGGPTPVPSGRLHFRDLHVEDFGDHAILLGEASEVECRSVSIERVAGGGFFVQGQRTGASQVACTGLRVRDCGKFALWLQGMTSVQVAAADLHGAGWGGVLVEEGRGVHLAGVRVAASGGALLVLNASSVTADALVAEGCYEGTRIEGSREVTLNGCRSSAISQSPLRILGGAGHVVSGFLSDQSGQAAFADFPHLRVGNGATQVLVSSFRRVNSGLGTLTWEADVSAAGGRVVFIQNDLTAGKVNSGGKYVQL